MTTNGVLLSEKKANLLKESGLNRLTVSLDTLNPENFSEISGSKYSPENVLEGINNAINAGLFIDDSTVRIDNVKPEFDELFPLDSSYVNNSNLSYQLSETVELSLIHI